MQMDKIDITRSVTDDYDSDLFATLGQLPLSTTLMGYLVVVNDDYNVNNLVILPPGTDIVSAAANPYPSGNSLSVTSQYGVHYVISNWILSERSANTVVSWDCQTSALFATNIFQVFGFIPSQFARRRLRIRRKLQRTQESERKEDTPPSVVLL